MTYQLIRLNKSVARQYYYVREVDFGSPVKQIEPVERSAAILPTTSRFQVWKCNNFAVLPPDFASTADFVLNVVLYS